MKNLNELEMKVVSGAGIESDDYYIETYPIHLEFNDKNAVDQSSDLIFDIQSIPSKTGTDLEVEICPLDICK